MKIDITQEPPADIFRERGKYLWICIVILTLAFCGFLLIGYGFLSDIQDNKILERTSLTILVGSALLFFYFGEKLKAYKKLGPEEKDKLAAMARAHPEIGTYCDLVAREDREPIYAEYEACQEWAEYMEHKSAQ